MQTWLFHELKEMAVVILGRTSIQHEQNASFSEDNCELQSALRSTVTIVIDVKDKRCNCTVHKDITTQRCSHIKV